jgi:serralysin
LATAVNASRTNNSEIDGLLAGSKWSGTITYSFPDSPSDYSVNYGANGEPTTAGFASAPAAMQQAIHYAFGLLVSYTNASVQFAGTNGANIAIGQSPAANPTSYAYYPSNVPAGGDVWFGTAYTYSLAALGNYYFATAMHELGHALGLKHSQETGGVANVAVPAAHDDLEYTVMSYRSYMGGPLTGYTNEAYGYPQTYMANDILALQTLYGANFTTHSENTVYYWSPTTGQEFINGVGQLAPGGGAGSSANRIFETVWDGNGIDTYDLSNYATAVSINLNPGAYSITSPTQIANLGSGHYAAGNIYNAYLYNNDPRSYIDNAVGGSGNDTLTGNAIANALTGGAGVDVLTGGGGADTFVFRSGDSLAATGRHDRITDFTSGVDYIDLTGVDGISSTSIHDNFLFIGSSPFDGGVGELHYFFDSSRGVTVLEGDTNGDRVADFAVDLSGNITVSASDLIGIVTGPIVIEAFGLTGVVRVDGNYYLNNNSSGSGPELKYMGANVVAGQFGGWTPIGAEQTSTGYQVAWKIPGTDQYTIWTTDSSANYITNNASVSGTSLAIESLESSFHQDLNGDGIIGIPVIEAFGLTSVALVGGNYYLNNNSSGSGPELKYMGTHVVAGQFGSWTPIGAEQTSTGYQVVWKVPGTDQYTIWTTDSSANYMTDNGSVSGTSLAIESLESSFHQDLNGDGVTGIPAIEAFGLTSVAQVGGNYYLNNNSSGSGPELKYMGAHVVAGQFGSWTPIGAEQTSTGYQVVWKIPGTDQYTIWSTDSSANYMTDNGSVSGTSLAIESLESSFHQDLNGDGVIGIPAIEALGSTGVTQVGDNYYLNNNSSGSGPELKYMGAHVVAGQFGGWTPIGAEQTSTGYQVAWKIPGTDQYTIWSTDSSANYMTDNGSVSGTSLAIESLESSFHQDLNGDGVIGIPVIEAFGLTSVAQAGGNYYLNNNSSGSGPELKYMGANVVAGQFGGWTPIGAEQTSTGYQVAWKIPGTDQYTIWTTDSSANYTTDNGSVSGTSLTIESLESSFHQDLNGDGVIGIRARAVADSDPVSVTNGQADNETFSFRPADAIVSTGNADPIELDGLWAVTSGKQLTALSNNSHPSQPQPLFELKNPGYDTIVESGSYEDSGLLKSHFADVLMNTFIIH